MSRPPSTADRTCSASHRRRCIGLSRRRCRGHPRVPSASPFGERCTPVWPRRQPAVRRWSRPVRRRRTPWHSMTSCSLQVCPISRIGISTPTATAARTTASTTVRTRRVCRISSRASASVSAGAVIIPSCFHLGAGRPLRLDRISGKSALFPDTAAGSWDRPADAATSVDRPTAGGRSRRHPACVWSKEGGPGAS